MEFVESADLVDTWVPFKDLRPGETFRFVYTPYSDPKVSAQVCIKTTPGFYRTVLAETTSDEWQCLSGVAVVRVDA
jgi:hypothetical protein